MRYRCPECRTRRTDFAFLKAHVRATGHKVCTCGHVSYGGTGFPHRPGSPYCIHNPMSAMWIAMKQGENAEVLRDIAIYIVADAPELAGKVRELCKRWGVIDNHVN